jgi:hypothetical protein
VASRRDFLAALKRELPEALRNLQKGNIAPVDLAQAAIGPGMAVFSRYARVLETHGEPMGVRTALSLINQSLDEVLAEQEGEFDADTRWALAWFDQYGFTEGAYGQAETLSTAKNTSVSGMVEAGIPVMGHVGLTPQSVRRLGGFKVQRDADELLADAKAVEEAGAFAIVVECVPADLGKRVTQALSVPTIGIGAGPACDGQVLVINDMLGMEQAIKPRFVKRQADLATIIRQAAERYAAEVRDSSYPGPEHVFN